MSASRQRSRSTKKSKSKSQDLLSGIPDPSELDLLLEGPEQIMGLKEMGPGGPGGPLFTQAEMKTYKKCTKLYITDIKKNEKLVLPQGKKDPIMVRAFVRDLSSHLDTMKGLHTKLVMNNIGNDKKTKQIYTKHQKQMEKIVKTIERLMRIYQRRVKGLQDIVGGPKNVVRLTGGPVKSAQQLLKDRELSRERKKKREEKYLKELQKKYAVPSDFDYDKTVAELEEMGYRKYKGKKGTKGKKGKKGTKAKKDKKRTKGGSLKRKNRSRRKTQRRR